MTKLAAAKQQETSSALGIWIVLAVIGIGGIGLAWILQLVQGMGITGLGEQVVWGLYIAGFFTAMGAGAALVALTALSEFVPLLPVARRRHALLLALAGFVVGGLLISMDVGNPINLWRILIAGRFTSLMTWDFLVLIVTGVLTIIYLVTAWKEQASTSNTRTLGVLALISATLLIIVEGWMLATLSARPLWTGGLTVVTFLVLALTAGLALAIMSWEEVARKLSGWLTTALWVTLGLMLIEFLTVVIDANVRPGPEVSLSLMGNLSGTLWTYLIVGLILPLVILNWRKDLLWLRIAAGLAVLGVLTEKLWLLSAGQALPWVPLPQASYAPSWIEYMGILGAIALSILIYRLLITIFKAEM
jgi:Ni/Fe-hydrogenase subunit HybB-like protein